jgi:prenyltransferase beta subunit
MKIGYLAKKICICAVTSCVGAALFVDCETGYADSNTVPVEETVTVDPQTKQIIDGALKYLASKQHLDGSWSLKEGIAGHPVAMTGYTLLAFMATGNLPDEGEYSRNVSQGMQFLLDSIQPNGLYRGVSQGQYMYNHGIATIALAELYGETRSPSIRVKLQRAIDLIITAQNGSGGWRYTPQSHDADSSVTVLQAVALRAAQEAGLAIPKEAVQRAIAYVSTCYDPHSGGFCYQPGKEPGFARTAAAIYSLQVLGQYNDPKVKTGSAFLFAHFTDSAYWTYGNYYAAPAQYMIGGETWQNWYAQVKKTLLNQVTKTGDTAHWEQIQDRNAGEFGPVYFTTVAIHILAMPYHYLPLYQR